MIVNFSNLKRFALPLIFGITGISAGGGFSLASYLSSKNSSVKNSSKNLLPSNSPERGMKEIVEHEKTQQEVSAEYIYRGNEDSSFLSCEKLIFSSEKNKKESMSKQECRDLVKNVWKEESEQDLPTMWLRAKQDKYGEALKEYFFPSEEKSFLTYKELGVSWQYGSFWCYSEEDEQSRIVVSCYRGNSEDDDQEYTIVDFEKEDREFLTRVRS